MSNPLLYLVTVLIWGSTWIAIEFQLGVVAPEVSVFYRYAAAAALLFGWCRWRGLQLRYPWRAHSRFVLLGTLLFSLNYVIAYHAQIYITSALTAIAFSTMLWMNIANSRLFFGVRAGARVLAGALLGICGIAVLFMPEIETVSLSDRTLYGAALAVLGAFVASLGNMVSQGAQKEGLPIVQSNAWGMFYGALLTGSFAFGQGQTFNFDWSADYVVSLMYLAVFGSVVAFGAYLTLLGRIGAHKAGYAVVMFPVVALVISFFFEGLVISIETVVGIALVIGGNLLVVGAKSESRPVPPDEAGEELLATN